jgi:hypothetical protein
VETIKLEGTNNTPKVLFDLETGEFVMEGRSFPEHPVPFFDLLLDATSKVKSKSINMTFQLDYVNTSSSKCILALIKAAEVKTNKNTKVCWISEEDDEDTEELGKVFEECTTAPFEFRHIA